MKRKILWIVFLVSFFNALAQDEIYYVKDTNREFTLDNISEANFEKVVNNFVVDTHSNGIFWFKIPKNSTNDESEYIFEIQNVEIDSLIYNRLENGLEKIPNELYEAFRFKRTKDVFIGVELNARVIFPLKLAKQTDFRLFDKKRLLYNGLYYGFSLLVILYCFVHFYFFRDYAFLYYSLFTISVVLGFLIMDGTLNLFGLSKQEVSYLTTLVFVSLAFFSSKFTNSFLFLNEIYPRINKYAYFIGFLILIFALLNIIYDNFIFYQLLSTLVFALILYYWCISIYLFKKNVYTKIYAISFLIILFSSLDTLILTNYGFSILHVNPTSIKLGGFIQIIVIWFSHLYREKYLRDQNSLMKEEIISYSDSKKYNDDKDFENLVNTLSFREKEIFNLITEGHSNKQIAEKTNVSINTVKFHIKNIYDKLEVKNRKEAMNLNTNS